MNRSGILDCSSDELFELSAHGFHDECYDGPLIDKDTENHILLEIESSSNEAGRLELLIDANGAAGEEATSFIFNVKESSNAYLI